MATFSSRRIRVANDAEAFFEDMLARGASDGLPAIPPTPAAVSRMLDAAGQDPAELIATIPPEGGPATAEKIAINAVMAGCLPSYFPVVLAAVRAIAQPRFNLLGVQTTTNPVAPVLVVNGPVREAIGLHSGRGCMGPGFRANATIGRAVRLVMLNIGGCPPGDVDKSIHGMPGKFGFCFAEREEDSPWEPLHVELGLAREESAVTAFGGQGTQNLYCAFLDPANVLDMVADGMGCYGNNGYLRASGNPLIVFSPGHAQMLANGGYDKRRIKQALFERTRIPRRRIPAERQLSKPIYTDYGPDDPCTLCRVPEDIMLVVAGGPEPYHVTYIPSFGTTEASIARVHPPA